MMENPGHRRLRIFEVLIVPISVVAFSLPIQAQKSHKAILLKFAPLSMIDGLPFYVVKANGYLSGHEITIIAVPVASGFKRDQLMETGEIEGQ